MATHYSPLMVTLAVIVTLYICTSAPALGRFLDQEELSDSETTGDVDQQWESLKEKRPFCNAFAGCGRKRAAAQSQQAYDRVLSNYPRLLNTDVKLWDNLYSKLQQRYRNNNGQSINN